MFEFELDKYIYVIMVIILISIVLSHYYLRKNIQTKVTSTIKTLTDIDTNIISKYSNGITDIENKVDSIDTIISKSSNGIVLKDKTYVKNLVIDTLPIEGFDTTSVSASLTVNGNTNTKSLNITGETTMAGATATSLEVNNLTVTGKVNFTDRNTSLMEIFPRYMIIAWGQKIIMNTSNLERITGPPLGWALCDGNNYVLNNDGTYHEATGTESGTHTPNLSNRFILGSNLPSEYGKIGGEESHKLIEDELPSHSHFMFITAAESYDDSTNATYKNSQKNYINAGNDSGNNNSYFLKYSDSTLEPKSGITGHTGGSNPHNNMPPFYVLTYIMKL